MKLGKIRRNKKMRLIDLDKVRWKEGFYDMHTGEQFASMIFNTPEWLEWATAEAEVKAVSIEWIKKKKVDFQNKDYPFNYCRGMQDGFNDCIDYLLSEWEKENDKDSE